MHDGKMYMSSSSSSSSFISRPTPLWAYAVSTVERLSNAPFNVLDTSFPVFTPYY